MLAEEVEPSGCVGRDELRQKEAAKEAREHADREEEAWPAWDPTPLIGRDATARHGHVDVGMVGERRAPSADTLASKSASNAICSNLIQRNMESFQSAHIQSHGRR